MVKRIIVGFTVLTLIMAVGMGQEHPQEHPEEKAKIDKDILAEAIAAYVKKDSELKGGYFTVYDKEAQKTIALELVRVHKDRLSRVEENVYFACADFRTPEGKMYDIDIFMKGSSGDNLHATEISIHKEEGKPRFTWYEEKGIWKKKEVKK